MEFPTGEVRQAWKNSWTGESEVLVSETGLLRRTISAKRIVELEYDTADLEVRSRTFFNQGTKEQPRKGALLQETRTLEVWHRDLSRPGIDAHRPILSKLKFDYVTGQSAKEAYGLFSCPSSA